MAFLRYALSQGANAICFDRVTSAVGPKAQPDFSSMRNASSAAKLFSSSKQKTFSLVHSEKGSCWNGLQQFYWRSILWLGFGI